MMCNDVRRVNALLSLFFHIPFPEDLEDEVWAEKLRQLEWLADKGLLGIKSVM